MLAIVLISFAAVQEASAARSRTVVRTVNRGGFRGHHSSNVTVVRGFGDPGYYCPSQQVIEQTTVRTFVR